MRTLRNRILWEIRYFRFALKAFRIWASHSDKISLLHSVNLSEEFAEWVAGTPLWLEYKHLMAEKPKWGKR